MVISSYNLLYGSNYGSTNQSKPNSQVSLYSRYQDYPPLEDYINHQHSINQEPEDPVTPETHIIWIQKDAKQIYYYENNDDQMPETNDPHRSKKAVCAGLLCSGFIALSGYLITHSQ